MNPLSAESSSVKIVFSNDELSAYLRFDGEKRVPSLSAQQVKEMLAGKGIVFGIREDLESALASFSRASEDLMVAQGVVPVSGNDGWIEYCFEVKDRSQENIRGRRADYHELGWIHNITKSESVAIVHPPENGTQGTTVRGKTIAANDGRRAEVRLGHGVEVDPKDPTRIIAAETGNAILAADGTIHVESTLTIRGNVDYSTGNIDFVGSVIVEGDVKTDFHVKAGGSITVQGNVEDATIDSGADVTIKNGFIGQGKGTLRAAGDVSVQHVLNQTIIAGHNIFIAREGVCATLQAGEKLDAPSGVFVGCTLQAGVEADVRNLGNGDQTQAKVRVGKRGIYLEQLAQLEREATKLQKQLEDAKAAIYKIVRVQLDSGTLSQEQAALQGKLRMAQSELTKRIAAVQLERDSAKARLEDHSLARVVVRETMFENVFVELNGVRKMMQGAIKEVVLTESNGKIEERSLE